MAAITNTFDRFVTRGRAQNYLDCLMAFKSWLAEHAEVMPHIWRIEINDHLDALWDTNLLGDQADENMERCVADAIAFFEEEPSVISAIDDWARWIESQSSVPHPAQHSLAGPHYELRHVKESPRPPRGL